MLEGLLRSSIVAGSGGSLIYVYGRASARGCNRRTTGSHQRAFRFLQSKCRQQHLTRQTVSVHFDIPDLIAAFPERGEGQARGREAVRRRRRLEVRLAPENHSHGREWTISSLTLSGRSSTG